MNNTIEEKILLVDDDENVLSGYKRSLRKKFNLETATGGELGLDALSNSGPFAVVVSDMQMPGMNGVDFLSNVKDRDPNTVRIMLTGNADQKTAMEAINEGNIFRFLTKPCSPEEFEQAIRVGLEQYRLVVAEQELLDKTLKGSINMLTEVLSLVNPDLFDKAIKLRDLIRELADFLKLPSSWEFEIAALLSQIGYLGIPPEVLVKSQKGASMTDEEKEILTLVPEVGGHLLFNIPRLDTVSNIVLYQEKHYDGSGFPANSVCGNKIPLGARILKILSDIVEIESKGTQREETLNLLEKRQGWYDPQVLQKVQQCLLEKVTQEKATPQNSILVKIENLEVGQTLSTNLKSQEGTLLLSSGKKISSVQLQRIRNYHKVFGLIEPIEVIPQQPAAT